ncbi:MAG: hypothetical protein ACFFD8_11030 [Candidatus Thorarchaeota archaeon]
MSDKSSQKVFTELAFYLWRIRYQPKEEWRPEILVMGSTPALHKVKEELESMEKDFQHYGQSTRKFACNPPEDFDVVRYARENQAEIEWLIWLVLKIEPDAPNVPAYELKNKAVTIRLNEHTLQQLIKVLKDQLEPTAQFAHGQSAPGGLFFAPDWLGVE